MDTTYELRIWIDHSQFFVEDPSNADAESWDLAVTFRAFEVDHLASKPGGLVVATTCQWGDVPVRVIVRPAPPAMAFDDWDHVAEGPLEVSSGQIALFAPEATASDQVIYLSVPPGSYRMRVLSGGLASSTGEDAEDGDEHYQIELWPSSESEIVVHKRGFWRCLEGKHPVPPSRE